MAHALADGIRAGQRRALARGITLVESTRQEHQAQSEELLTELLPDTGGAIRIGISGTPGVGKSTFIDAFGSMLTAAGLQLAVLAVDPSSTRTGGSILGDKTRMDRLSRDPRAFVRPSPSSGTLGGVARRTREAMLLCEAAGFDVVFVETVGVGQSETTVSDMVDLFLLLLGPAGGDELQGIKRGIMELADLIVVNKADGDFLAQAKVTGSEYRTALHLMRPKWEHWTVPVLLASALREDGLDEIWEAIRQHHVALDESGEIEALRATQATRWMWFEITDGLAGLLRSDPVVARELPALEQAVRQGSMLPAVAAGEILEAFHRTR